MKKMSKSAQIQTNGAGMLFVINADGMLLAPIAKTVLKIMCASHNQINPSHNAHVC